MSFKFWNSESLNKFILKETDISNSEITCYRNSSVGMMYYYIAEIAYILQLLTKVSAKCS